MLYKVTLYARNKAGNRFRLEWLVGVDWAGDPVMDERTPAELAESCRKRVEDGLDAAEGVGYFNRDWHVTEVENGVHALPAVHVPAPQLMVPLNVKGDGGTGC